MPPGRSNSSASFNPGLRRRLLSTITWAWRYTGPANCRRPRAILPRLWPVRNRSVAKSRPNGHCPGY